MTGVLVALQRTGEDRPLAPAAEHLVALLRSWGPGPQHLTGLALAGITLQSRLGPRRVDALVFTRCGVVVIAAHEPGPAEWPGPGDRTGAAVAAARGALAGHEGGRYVTGLVAVVPPAQSRENGGAAGERDLRLGEWAAVRPTSEPGIADPPGSGPVARSGAPEVGGLPGAFAESGPAGSAGRESEWRNGMASGPGQELPGSERGNGSASGPVPDLPGSERGNGSASGRASDLPGPERHGGSATGPVSEVPDPEWRNGPVPDSSGSERRNGSASGRAPDLPGSERRSGSATGAGQELPGSEWRSGSPTGRASDLPGPERQNGSATGPAPHLPNPERRNGTATEPAFDLPGRETTPSASHPVATPPQQPAPPGFRWPDPHPVPGVAVVLADPRGLRRIIAQHNRWRTVWSADDVLDACYSLSLAHLAPPRAALIAEGFPARLPVLERLPELPAVIPVPSEPPAPVAEDEPVPWTPPGRGHVFPRQRPIREIPWGLLIVLTVLVAVGLFAAVFVAQVFHGS